MSSDSTAAHHLAAGDRSVTGAVLTISDTRTPETDKGGPLIRRLLMDAGHEVRSHAIVKDEPAAIDAQLEEWLASSKIQVILTTGGTGIARRDTTIEIVTRKLTAPLHGFGELFRMLSWEEVGAAAMLSRAIGGLVSRSEIDGGDTFIFAMPGSTNAIETAMTKLIVPELSHLVWERRK